MGVPSFFRWLAQKYPHILDDVLEGDQYRRTGFCHVSGPVPPPSPSEAAEMAAATGTTGGDGHAPLPDGAVKTNLDGEFVQIFQVDNLYLDCNGVIHPCCHPEGGMPQPRNEEEMFDNVALFLNRLFDAVQPRKLLFLAIDGVAPRAKMNQQRSRRFCSAREAEEIAKESKQLRALAASQGRRLPDEPAPRWDHNVITPGTAFMARLAVFLREFLKKQLRDRAASDSRWSQVTVILSDATVPGEGEHKIMEYIRAAKRSPGYDPNTSHCICGQDADLMMLALALHEPRVCILREKVVLGRKRKTKTPVMDTFLTRPLQFLHVSRLRAYLRKDFGLLQSHRLFNFERIVDDFVLICFLVGNDFLPHMSAISINTGGIDLMQIVYCQTFDRIGGYLTDGCEVNAERLERLMQVLGAMESEIFKSQYKDEVKRAASQKEKAKREEEQEKKRQARRQELLEQREAKRRERQAKKLANGAAKRAGPGKKGGQEDSESEAEMYDLFDDDDDDDEDNEVSSGAGGGTTVQNAMAALSSEELKELIEKARLEQDKKIEGRDKPMRMHEQGYRERYYQVKLGKDNNPVERLRMVHEFVRGMKWVMHYYYKGVLSWDWYYPFHYPPLVVDFVHLNTVNSKFDMGQPFPPIGQLMAVLPEASSHCLPVACKALMKDKRSPILDFYPPLTGPGSFRLDPNGKPAAVRWLWIAVLPFIDSDRLLTVLDGIQHTFTEEEKQRNSVGSAEIYISQRNKTVSLTDELQQLYNTENKKSKPLKSDSFVPGRVAPVAHGRSCLAQYRVLTARYELPPVGDHKSTFNEGGNIAVAHAVPEKHLNLPSKPARLPISPFVANKVLMSVGAQLPPVYLDKMAANGNSHLKNNNSNSKIGRNNTSRGVCYSGAECQRSNCHFTHPTSTSASVPQQQPSSVKRTNSGSSKGACRFGFGCTRPNCRFSHPAGAPAKAVTATRLGGRPCRFGDNCTRNNCHFVHSGANALLSPVEREGGAGTGATSPAGGKTGTPKARGMCWQGDKCKRPNCHFTHPTTVE